MGEEGSGEKIRVWNPVPSRRAKKGRPREDMKGGEARRGREGRRANNI